MISIENLYWVLYETLIKPTKLAVRYFYPFGTIDYLSIDEFHPFTPPMHNAHVLFHFDQEPIDQHTDHVLLKAHDGNRFKSPMLLANSEHSAVKKKICREYNMLDWYFFYHGFAALDWYRDAQFVDTDQEINNHFCSLNRTVTGDRAYRMILIAHLASRNLLQFGSVSMHATSQDIDSEINHVYSKLSDQDKILIVQELRHKANLPLVADHVTVDGSFSARFGVHEFRFWQRSFMHLVTETIFYHDKLHLTEKIFRPIVSQRPFVLVAAAGNLAYLRQYGFRTFGNWIDESYDNEPDPHKRLCMIVDQVNKVCALSMKELALMLSDMRSVLDHNKRHLFNEFRHIIVNELVDNFDQCIRLWNNGRIDRLQSRHPDLALAKQVLLR